LEFLNAHPWLLALAIFAARILDVSLGTLRTITIFRGYRLRAAALGFFEVLVWLLAAAQVIRNLDSWYLVVAYASGFAAGNAIGMWLESKLALGLELVRVISRERAAALSEQLRRDGYEVTGLAGTGTGREPVEVLLIVAKRRRIPYLLRTIAAVDPDAFCTFSDVRQQPFPRRHRTPRYLARPDWLRLLKKK
jgi:uncharacterized protein YebE (UPF0316 family)